MQGRLRDGAAQLQNSNRTDLIEAALQAVHSVSVL